MRTMLACLAVAMAIGAASRGLAQESERFVVDGLALRLPAGYGVAGDGSGALALRAAEDAVEGRLRSGEGFRVAFRDMARAASGPVIMVTGAVPGPGGAVPVSDEVGGRWLGRPGPAGGDPFGRRDYWVRTGMASAPVARVSCGDDGCRVGARLSEAIAVEIAGADVSEAADLTAQASAALRALLPPEA